MSGTHVIVGASLAGAKAAETLREEGFGGPIVLIGDEEERPYERPSLSKDYLMGKAERETIYVHPQAWYAEHDVDLRLGTLVTGLDPTAHEVALADGSRIGYSKLLLATGSAPRRLPVPGADAEGVRYLRRVADSDRIRATLQTATRIAVIGAGWIGLETAAAARSAGVEVTVLETAELPLLRVLGREVAEAFAALHREHGVDLRFGVQVAEITGSGGRPTASGWPTAVTSRPMRSSSGSASRPTASSPTRPAWRLATGSWSTPGCGPATRTSTPRGTWRTPTIRCSGGTSGSSTGPTR